LAYLSVVLAKNVKIIDKIIDEAMDDVELYCNENLWISDIKKYLTAWSIDLLDGWVTMGTFRIDEELAKIRSWVETIKHMEKIILTKNRVFKIDCSSVETILVPHLDSIYAEIGDKITKDNTKNSQEFVAQLTKILKQLDQKPETIEDFAYYAKIAFRHKNNMTSFGEKGTLYKGLWDIIRGSYRILNTDEELLDSQSQDLYKKFVFKLQDSIEFVNSQSPEILKQINLLYQVKLIK
jgi:dynein heavy chain, axonemal